MLVENFSGNAFTLAVNLTIVLVWFHILLDYALQGDFMSKAKNPVNSIPGVPSLVVMSSHAFLQAGPVYLFTGMLALGIAELVAHFVIDTLKCRGVIDFATDQILHIICKLIWVVVVLVVLQHNML